MRKGDCDLEAISRIWNRLFRVDPSRAERGLGLGLSLVKAITVAHHGRVAVESAPDRGSSFLLSVPLTPRVVRARPPKAVLPRR